MKKRTLVILFAAIIMSLTACGKDSEEEQTEQEEQANETESVVELEDENTDDSKLSQSEWMEQHSDDYEDGYENVDAINIDGGTTKLSFIRSEKYTLQEGEEAIAVYFTFENVSAGETSLHEEYNFSAYQDGVEVDAYSIIGEGTTEFDNADKSILSGASVDIAIVIEPSNWESPIKLRADNSMPYDDGTDGKVLSAQQQELATQ